MTASVELPEPSGTVARYSGQIKVGTRKLGPSSLDSDIEHCLQYLSDCLAAQRFLAVELDQLIDRARAHAHAESPVSHGATVDNMTPEAQKYWRALVRFIQDESK